MSAGTLLLWRHGQTDYNATARLQGQVDIALNEHGRAQAAAAAPFLAQLSLTRIVASDLMRAAETAQSLADLVGLDVGTDARLRERSFGDWEGLTHPEIEAGWPDAFAAWNAGAHPEGVNAETRGEVGHRFAEAVLAAAEPLGEHEILVVVSHGAAISAGITALIGQDPEVWRGITGIGNCHWSVLRTNDGQRPSWRLSAHNVGVREADFAVAARIV
ncbi:histidine phosphatase family protein [Occultella glacieicola]|uniref:Histidine phosphatase family protein n=1 Tax=Occultella glacieicola TaxID=2518684 RepID=A0ABY2DYX0_9MICO|nr:histidine phosphatase family protein [Occultella glacieicola]TDE89690.1 histidine phosphatase family protein [Occultella glacieicola]